MFKRVTANLTFTQEDEAEDFYHDCEIALAKAITINPGQPDVEISYIILQKCFHDEDPNKPCELIDEASTFV